jgi:hypothetical protein
MSNRRIVSYLYVFSLLTGALLYICCVAARRRLDVGAGCYKRRRRAFLDGSTALMAVAAVVATAKGAHRPPRIPTSFG